MREQGIVFVEKKMDAVLTYAIPYSWRLSELFKKLINDTPERVKDNINTHSLQGFINYGKNDMIHKYGNICIIQHCYTYQQSQLHQ